MPVHARLCLPDMTAELRHLRAFVAIATRATSPAPPPGCTSPSQRSPAPWRSSRRTSGCGVVDRSTHHLDLTPAGEVFRDKGPNRPRRGRRSAGPHARAELAVAPRPLLGSGRLAHHRAAAALAAGV